MRKATEAHTHTHTHKCTKAEMSLLKLMQLAENDPQAYADFLKSQARAAEAEQSQQLVKGSTAQFIIEAQLAQQADKASMALVHVWAARDGACGNGLWYEEEGLGVRCHLWDSRQKEAGM